jgi:hypothetical protein
MRIWIVLFALSALSNGCAVPQSNDVAWDYRGAWVPADSLRMFEEIVLIDSVKMLMRSGDLVFGSNAFYGSASKEGMVVSVRPENLNRYRLHMKIGDKNPFQGMTLVLDLLSADTLRILMDSAGVIGPKAPLMVRNPTSRTAETVSEISRAIKHIYETLNHEVNLLDESSISKLPVYGDVVETSSGVGMLKAAMLDRHIETDGMVGVAELTDDSCIANFKIELVSDDRPKQERRVRAHMKRVNGQWRMKFSDLLGDSM